jgi:hypothetical protein
MVMGLWRLYGDWTRFAGLLFCVAEFFLGVEEAAEAVEAAGFAEDDHAFEEGRGHGASGDDGAEEHEVFFDGPLLLFA